MTDQACNDPKCPSHGSLRVRGQVVQGLVRSTKAAKTAVVVVQYATRVPKYERYEKRRSTLHAHVPPCMSIKEGDTVEVSECRKLSKTKAFVITAVITPAKANN